MCPEDDEYKAKVEIIPPGKRSQEIEPRKEARQLPALDLPPRGVIRIALYTAIKYKMTSRAIDAYEGAVRSTEGALRALDDLDLAVLERDRTIRLLEDAETIHETDELIRKAQRIEVDRSFKDTEARGRLADMKRERMLSQEEEKHRRWQQQQQGGEGGFDPDNLTEEEQEAQAELEARVEKKHRATEQLRFKDIAEAVIEKFIRERGGENNLTEEDQEYVRMVRNEAENMAKESEEI